jgi:hypothetical protein
VANCQVGVSVHAATDQASCPINWRLFLPEDCNHDAERRAKAHVPDRERHRPKWQLALELLDELAGWELVAPVVLADGAYGEVNQFRLGLEQHQLADVVQAPGHHQRLPRARAARNLALHRPWAAVQAALPPAALVAAPAGGGRWRAGGHHGRLARRRRRGTVALPVCGAAGASSRAAVAPARPRHPAAGAVALADWPQGEPEPVTYWLASLPAETRWRGWGVWPGCAGEWSTIIAS